MAEPDILLNDRETKVIGRMELLPDDNDETSIVVNPFDEELIFGQIEEGSTRSEISPELIESDELRGKEVGLGGGQEYRDEGRLRVYRGGDQDLEPRLGVDVNGGGKTQTSDWAAGVTIYDDGSQSLTVGPNHVQMDAVDIRGSDRAESKGSIRVGGAQGGGGGDTPPKKGEDSPRRGDAEYHSGEITVKGDSGYEGEATTTAKIRGASENRDGGSMTLYDKNGQPTVDVDAWEARLTLGQKLLGDVPDPGTGGEVSAPGVSGKLTLNDGNGELFHVTADNGTLKVEHDSLGSLFEIDTQGEEIRTKYEIKPGTL